MDGIRLICRTLADTQFLSIPGAMVVYSPSTRYRIEKTNAYDPTIIHRREPYHLDTFDIDAPLTPQQYRALDLFTRIDGQFYLEYTSDNVLRQFPVTVTSYPKCPDDLHEYTAQTTLRFESRYIQTPGVINWFTISTSDFHETVVTP